MKAKIEFNLLDPIERNMYDFVMFCANQMDLSSKEHQEQEIEFFKKAKDFYFSILDFDNELRNIVKHGPTQRYNESEIDTVDKIRDDLYRNLSEYNVEMHLLS